MKQSRIRRRAGLIVLSLVIFWSSLLVAAPAVTIEYEVWMKDPHSHYLDVQIKVTGLHQNSIDLIMPVWTPGSYMIRDYARHVTVFSATDGSGTTLPSSKLNKYAWRVQLNQASVARIQYRVYAFDDSMRGNYLDGSHAFINGASLFMYVDGHLRHPVRVKIHPAPTWNVISTGLDPVGGQEWTYQAPDYDVLADGPIEIGRHQVLEFTARGVPHRIAIYGTGEYREDHLVEATRRIADATIVFFDETPYKHYTFIVHLTPTGSGGLEHSNSSVLNFPRRGFEPSYHDWASLVAHELFHVWNGKRIRPRELGPFDYTRENYSRSLWVVEGFTDYYSDRLLLQTGFITEREYLNLVAGDIDDLHTRPGRQVQSVVEASFDAWIKFYQPNENSFNTTVSYYNKGKILAAMLDLEIRYLTRRTRSLDDVMRTLQREFSHGRNIGYTEAEFRQVCEQVAGDSLSQFFDQYVYGTAEINYNRFLEHAGLQLTPVVVPQRGYLGAVMRSQDGKVLVARVLDGTPAQKAGVYAGDEIVALDEQAVGPDSYEGTLQTKKPGDRLTITLTRKGILQKVNVTLTRTPTTDSQIVWVEEPTPEQEALYRGWVSLTSPTTEDRRP